MILPACKYYPRDLNNAATSRILVNRAVIYIFINNCKFVFVFICVNIGLILNSFYNTALFDKKVSLFNLYAMRVGLDNAATSRILVKPAVILIL